MIYLYIIMLFVYIVLIYISFSRLTMALTIYLWLPLFFSVVTVVKIASAGCYRLCSSIQTRVRENVDYQDETTRANYYKKDNVFVKIIWYFTNIFLLYHFFLILHSHALLIYAFMHIELILLWEWLPLGIFLYRYDISKISLKKRVISD